jgi:hypothetical protein
VAAKRLLVLGLSAVVGAGLTLVMIVLIQTFMQSNVTIAYYGYDYFTLTALFVGAAAFVWIDHLFGTGMLPK